MWVGTGLSPNESDGRGVGVLLRLSYTRQDRRSGQLRSCCLNKGPSGLCGVQVFSRVSLREVPSSSGRPTLGPGGVEVMEVQVGTRPVEVRVRTPSKQKEWYSGPPLSLGQRPKRVMTTLDDRKSVS